MKRKSSNYRRSILDQRPTSQEQLDRLDRWAWDQDPEGYARRVWKRINQMAEG